MRARRSRNLEATGVVRVGLAPVGRAAGGGRDPAPGRGPGQGGFTLVELMVVIVILAILAVVVIPQVTGTSSMKAQSAARLVMSDLEYAQDLAITSQSDITVTFDTSGNFYGVSNESGPLNHPITKKTYVVDFDTVAGLNGVSLSNASFGAGSSVTFDSLGAPTPDGSVSVSAGDSGYRVTVAPITGRVTVAVTQ